METMDSRSKYANLPFVAIGERDVFETEDNARPEADQLLTREPPVLWDASVDVIACGRLEALQRFADTKTEDFVEKTTSESLLDRYNRLRDETQELIDLSSKDTNHSNKDLIAKVDQLSQQLQELQVLRYDNSNTLKDVFNSLDKPLNQSEDKTNEAKNEVKYQLFYKPEHCRLQESSKINSLEQRIKRIETALGGSDHKLSLLNNYFKEKSISESVQELNAKVSQFDQSSLERVDSRLHMITDKLSQIADRKAQLEELEKSSKLSELYDLIHKTEKSRASLPNILERLETLSELQEQAMQFSSGLSYLDSLQTQVTDSMKNNEKQLELMKASFEKNVEAIKEIILDFDKRLQALK